MRGDQPVDGSRLPQQKLSDERDSFAASLIEREILHRDRKGFVLLCDSPVGDLYTNDLLEKGTKRVKLVSREAPAHRWKAGVCTRLIV